MDGPGLPTTAIESPRARPDTGLHSQGAITATNGVDVHLKADSARLSITSPPAEPNGHKQVCKTHDITAIDEVIRRLQGFRQHLDDHVGPRGLLAPLPAEEHIPPLTLPEPQMACIHPGHEPHSPLPMPLPNPPPSPFDVPVPVELQEYWRNINRWCSRCNGRSMSNIHDERTPYTDHITEYSPETREVFRRHEESSLRGNPLNVFPGRFLPPVPEAANLVRPAVNLPQMQFSHDGREYLSPSENLRVSFWIYNGRNRDPTYERTIDVPWWSTVSVIKQLYCKRSEHQKIKLCGHRPPFIGGRENPRRVWLKDDEVIGDLISGKEGTFVVYPKPAAGLRSSCVIC